MTDKQTLTNRLEALDWMIDALDAQAGVIQEKRNHFGNERTNLRVRISELPEPPSALDKEIDINAARDGLTAAIAALDALAEGHDKE